MHDTDRRVIYTKKILRSSLMKLLQDKPIGRISVTELCNTAGVNRGTFYSHYRQPEDVMHQIEDEIIGEIEKVLNSENDVHTIFRNIIQMLDNNRSACRVLFGENGDPECVKRILAVSNKYFQEKWCPALGLTEQIGEYVHTFLSSGTAQVLREWLIGDDIRSAFEIADIITDLQKKVLQR